MSNLIRLLKHSLTSHLLASALVVCIASGCKQDGSKPLADSVFGGGGSSGGSVLPLAFSYTPSVATYTINATIISNIPSTPATTNTSHSVLPALPAGLSLSPTTGVISGKPTALSPAADYVVTRTNGFGSQTATINIAIVDTTPIVSFPSSPYVFTKGVAITPKIPTSSAGTVIACASSPALPAGLVVSPSCVLSGTPTVIAPLTTYTLTAFNSGGSSTAPIVITVNDAAPSTLVYAGSPFSFVNGNAITPQIPTSSGGAITSCASSPALPTGLSLAADCTLSGTPVALTAVPAVFTITGSNTGGSTSTTISLASIDVPPSSLFYAGAPFIFTTGATIVAQTPGSSGGAITSCSSSPALPTGLALSSACVLSGTPTVITAATSYTITAANSGGSTTTTISIATNDLPPAGLVYANAPFTFVKGTAITLQTPTSTGGAITSCASAPTLPAGLSLNATCQLSGTPTVVAATASYVVTATNSGGSTTATISITVNDVAPASLVYTNAPFTFTNGTAITSETPTSSGGAIVSCASSPALPTGLALSATCVLSGTPTVLAPAANYTITATNTGGSTTATISITVNDVPPSALVYTNAPFVFANGAPITPETPTASGGAITSCASSPALPTGLTLGTDCVLSGTPTAYSPAANYTITATNTGGSTSATISITVNDVPPSSLVYSNAPFTFVNGTAITAQTPTASGGAITSCASSPALPAGLSLNSTCVLSGTPSVVSAAASYTITATNSGGSTTATISITVNDVAPSSLVYTSAPFTFTNGAAITAQTPTSSGGLIISCASSPALPAGLALSATCVLSGTPTVLAPTANYTITATNTGGSTTATISITVNDVPPSALVFANAPFTFVNGAAITTETPTASGGPIVSCASSPALPAGLSLSSTCVLSGTPSVVAAAANYTITATNTGGSTSATISITVNDVAPSSLVYTNAPFTFVNGSAITAQTPTALGGPITSCASSPALPAGLTLSATCVLSGTPSVVASVASYTITATNSGGSTTATISITVNDIAPSSLVYASAPFTFTKSTAITAQTPTSSGGAIVSCASSPALPSGLALTSACVLSGTPTVLATAASYTITATNTGGSTTATISITVNDIAPSSLTYSNAPFTFVKGSAISAETPTSSGGAIVSCASSPALPAGLSLNSTCVLSGTPSVVAAAANYTITATNTGGSTTATISITVNDIPPVIAYPASPYVLTINVAAGPIGPTSTGGAVVSCSVSPALPAGLSVDSGCVVMGTPSAITASAAYTVTATNSGGSASTSITISVVDVPPSITYPGSPFTLTMGSAAGPLGPTSSAGPIVSCAITPALPAGLSIDSGCVIAGTPSALSTATSYTVTATNSGGTSNATISVTVIDVAPSALVFAGAPFTFTKNAAISAQTPTSSGGAIVSCASSPALPTGLALSSACVLSGTPTGIVATASYTITATNTGGSTAATLSITVNDVAPSSLVFANAPFTFTKGSAIASETPTSSGGTIVSCASSPTLPAGLALSATCVLSGTPSVVAAGASYTITATNSGGSTSTTISVTVIDIAPAIAYTGSPFTFVLNNASGPVGPSSTGGSLVGCSSSPALPTGLSIDAGCVISGTPTVLSAASSYTITATNSGGSGTATISIGVVATPPTSLVYTNAPFTFTMGSAITAQTPTSSGDPITGCSASPALPTGLSLSSACVLSGTPTVIAATASYTITATNTGGSTNATVSITVNDVAPSNLVFANAPFVFSNGVAISAQTPTSSGGTITSCSSSPALPNGLVLSATCVLSGTPAVIASLASYTITATNSGGSTTKAISITVNDVAPSSLAYAGSPFTFTKSTAISAQTPTKVGGAITSCSSSPALPAGLALSSACVLSGTPTTKQNAAPYTITATNTGGSTTASISITIVNPAYSLSLSTVTLTSGTVVSGATTTATLQIKDATGTNQDTTGLTIVFGTTGGTSTGSFGPTTDNADGTYSANFTGVLAGTATTVTATIAGSSVTSTMPTITVVPGAVASMAFTQQPNASRTAGQVFTSVKVTLYDAAGNIATNSSDVVSLDTDDVGCTAGDSPGGTLSVAPAAGIATFTAAYSTIVGTGYCLMASIPTGVTTTTSSSTYSVTYGTLTKLVFVQQPSTEYITAPISPAIVVGQADAYGNVNPAAAAKSVTLSISTNPGASTISGTNPKTTVSGVSTFSDISLNNAGSGYVLTAAATGLTSAVSAPFDIVTTSPVNIETAVELVDAGISSNTAALKAATTSVNIDPTLYDGTVTYSFEIIAKNTHATTAYTVTLNSKAVVTSGAACSTSTTYTSVSTISVPALTTSFKRFTGTITTPTTAKGYAISLPATAAANNLQIASARILIKQVGARKTRIYVPIASGPEGTYLNTATGPVIDTTTSTTYGQPNPNRYYRWKKDVSKLITMAATNAITLDTVTSNSANSTATLVRLKNVTSGNAVTGALITQTTSTTSANKVYACVKSFAKNAVNFDDDNEFELEIATAAAATARLHKAGLWIALTGVTNLVTYNRLMQAQTITTATTPDTGRRQFNTSNFTSPTVSYECMGSETTAGITPRLVTHGVNVVGTAGTSPIGLSGLTFSGATKQKINSGSISITDGDFHLPDFTGTGSLSIGSCMGIIQVN